MNITLTLNGRDFSPRVSTYECKKVLEEIRKVVTIDRHEHVVSRTRDEVAFTLVPYNQTTDTDDYNALSAIEFTATYTDPKSNADVTKTLRLVTDLNSAYGLTGVDNKRYYKGGQIRLRAVEAN